MRLRVPVLVFGLLLLSAENVGAQTISTLNPSSVVAGGTAFTLTVNGSGFTGRSVVLWNGSRRSTTTVSSTALSADIGASDITATGSVRVQVCNLNPPRKSCQTISNTIFFQVLAGSPSPVVTISISPSSATITSGGQQQFAAAITGTSNTAVLWSIGLAGGSIDSTGLFTAPSVTATTTGTIKATS